MSLLRAEVRNRLGDASIYDCIVENVTDFSNEPMLDRVHTGSIALCLNLDSQNNGGNASAPVSYIKTSDGSWDVAPVSNAYLMNLMESLMTQKIMGMTGSGSVTPGPIYIAVNSGQFIPATDTYAPDPVEVQEDWDHFLIWTEDTFTIGRRNINGAVIWKKSNSILAYNVMYTNLSGSAGIVSHLPNGGSLYSLDNNNQNKLCFGADVSFGVYASGTTYKWIAWKEGA